jgi:hypothetical protein
MKRYKFIDEVTIVPIDYNLELSLIKEEYEKILEMNSITDEDIISIKAKRKKTDIEKQKLELRLSIENDFSERIDKLSEYKELVDGVKPSVGLGEFDILRPLYSFNEKENVIVRNWQVENNNYSLILNKMNNLKQKLSNSDYKVLKCYEAKLTSSDLPYDLDSLILERQSQRDEINKLNHLIESKNEQ